MIYRLQCGNSFCDASNDNHRVRLPPRDWHGIQRFQSYADSVRLNPREGESDFSLSNWHTHYGVCPACYAKGIDERELLADAEYQRMVASIADAPASAVG